MTQLALDGSPIVELPPDWVSDVELFAPPTAPWHIPTELFNKVWAITRGESVTVCVLDTGMNSHEQLPEPIHAQSFISGESWKDGNGHGTHVAGTILGRNVIGLAPAAKLMVGKVLSNGGSGSSQGIADGINWAVDNGADIISMSLGSSSPYTPMESAITRAWTKGVVVVAAAGNSGFNGSNNTIGYPSKYLNCLCIGAYRSDGSRASFSSGGRELDVICPGQDIISSSKSGGYVSMSGTSMATPYCAGLMALVVSIMKREGHLAFQTADECRQFLAKNSEDQGTPGHDPSTGFGIPRPATILEAIRSKSLTFA